MLYSLLVIPPPIGRMVPQGGFLSDLTELNLLGWADLVQDVVVGLQALLPRLCLNSGTPAIALLQLLEAATGVGFVTTAATQDPTVHVREPRSQLPPRCGARLFSRPRDME